MQRHYRRIVFRLYRRFRHPRILKRNRFMHWFARHFLDKTVWKPTRHTFAGGLAVGLFVMMLVIPGQMPLAIAGGGEAVRPYGSLKAWESMHIMAPAALGAQAANSTAIPCSGSGPDWPVCVGSAYSDTGRFRYGTLRVRAITTTPIRCI